MPTYTKKTIMEVLNYFNTDYTARQQESDAQINIWVNEGKTDGNVVRDMGTIVYPETYVVKYIRVWVDEAAAQAYQNFGNTMAPKYDDEIISFEIVDNV